MDVEADIGPDMSGFKKYQLEDERGDKHVLVLKRSSRGLVDQCGMRHPWSLLKELKKMS